MKILPCSFVGIIFSIRGCIVFNEVRFAVNTAIWSFDEKVVVTNGNWIKVDMKTGTFELAVARSWKCIINPQSPVMALTDCESSHFTASMNSFSTSMVILIRIDKSRGFSMVLRKTFDYLGNITQFYFSFYIWCTFQIVPFQMLNLGQFYIQLHN